MKRNEFSSLINNPEWMETIEIYEKYKLAFKDIEKNFSQNYRFDDNDVKNSLIYEIMTLQYKDKKNRFLSKKYFKYSFLYLIIMLILTISFPFSLIYNLFKKNKEYDLLYEEMWNERSWYSRFYKYIDSYFSKSIDRALLFTNPSLKVNFNGNEVQEWKDEVFDIRDRAKVYDYRIILKVLLKDFFFFIKLYKMSKKFNANFIFIYLYLLRRLLLHTSQVTNINARVLVSAGDYYWNPIKYMCYKKKINYIILLQHNYKSDYLYGRIFPYCDYYFGHSSEALEKIEGIPFSKKYSIGSLQLVPFLSKEKNIEYDILLINQTVYDDNLVADTPLLDQKKLISQYLKLLNYLHRYLKFNENINVVVMAKNTYMNKKPMTLTYEQFKDIKNIEFKEAYGDKAFELITKSNIVLNMYSSIGIEAYGLDKKVLWVNYENCCSLFEFNIEKDELHILLKDDSYDDFADRLNLLLSKNKEVDEHFIKLKERYMNIQENPAKIVANKIEELIG